MQQACQLVADGYPRQPCSGRVRSATRRQNTAGAPGAAGTWLVGVPCGGVPPQAGIVRLQFHRPPIRIHRLLRLAVEVDCYSTIAACARSKPNCAAVRRRGFCVQPRRLAAGTTGQGRTEGGSAPSAPGRAICPQPHRHASTCTDRTARLPAGRRRCASLPSTRRPACGRRRACANRRTLFSGRGIGTLAGSTLAVRAR